MKRLFLALTFPLMLLPGLAHAQSSGDKAAAETLFEQGRLLMTQGKFAEACRKLEGSQKLDPGAGTLLNLAACYEKNGQTASAWVTYKDAAIASSDRHPDWTTAANKKVDELVPNLSRLTITVTGTVPNLDVRRDGESVSSAVFGTALPVDPGVHAIEARAPGRKTFKQTVTIGPSKDQQSVVVPYLDEDFTKTDDGHHDALPLGPTPEPSPPTNKTQLILGGVITGVGVVGLGVGGVFGLMALGKKSDASANCTSDFQRCTSVGLGQVDDAKSLGTVSTVAFIAGGVLAVGGLVLVLTAPKGEKPAPTVHAAMGAPGAAAGLTLGGTF